MVLLFELRFSGWWMQCWFCMVLLKGCRACQRHFTGRSNFTTELQSDVLLPCIFNPALLGSDETADIAAVWSQKNTTSVNLVEIQLHGAAMFWKSRSGRIKVFSNLSECGNFSILLHNVQLTDLGLYHCELFNGINCSLAYQEVQLDLTPIAEYQKSIIAGTSGGILILLIACVFYIASKRRSRTRKEGVCDNPIYDSISHTIQDRDRRDEGRWDNPIYTVGDLEEPEKLRVQQQCTSSV